MSAPYTAIPFEKQSDPQNSRMCGAACLSMVYRSFGKEVPQAEIWPAISRPNRFGVVSSITHLMALDAIRRGFSAVAIQARHPLQALRLSREAGIRAILNHRLEPDSPAGHYSVLVDIDGQGVVLHDPYFGPSRRLEHDHLLDLWQPKSASSEIAGNILLAISAVPLPAAACEFCHTPAPAAVACPQCKKPVGLLPGAPLGCMNNLCIARMWNYLCCPSCDYTWTFSLKQPEPGAPTQKATPAEKAGKDSQVPPSTKEPLDPAAMFAQLDKFLGLVATIPAAVEHPEILQQIASLKVNREKLVLSRAEAMAHQLQSKDRMSAMQQEAAQRKEAFAKQVEETGRKSPPLDGDALGHALLKNLGFK